MAQSKVQITLENGMKIPAIEVQVSTGTQGEADYRESFIVVPDPNKTTFEMVKHWLSHSEDGKSLVKASHGKLEDAIAKDFLRQVKTDASNRARVGLIPETEETKLKRSLRKVDLTKLAESDMEKLRALLGLA